MNPSLRSQHHAMGTGKGRGTDSHNGGYFTLYLSNPAEYCGNVASSRPCFTPLTWAFAGCFLPLLSNLVSLLSHNLQGCSTKRVYLNKETIDPEIHNIWINPASDVHSCNLLYFHPSHSPFPGKGCFPSLPCSYRRSAVSMETQTGSST